jgi:hypothetical protein
MKGRDKFETKAQNCYKPVYKSFLHACTRFPIRLTVLHVFLSLHAYGFIMEIFKTGIKIITYLLILPR